MMKRWLHTTHSTFRPRGLTRAENRFGQFQRLVPASLATTDVSQIPRRSIPSSILKPPYAVQGTSSHWGPEPAMVKSDEEKAKMRAAGQLAKKILDLGATMCQAGTTTNMIDQVVHQAIVDHGAYPSPLNYMGFPKSVCTSINNIIAHGIPDDRPLVDGDLINIDVTVYLDGFHGDTSATFLVGQVDEQGKALVECTRETLEKALAICGPDVPYREIGRVICDHASRHGFSVSNELSGHGIGREFHSLPLIYHHVNQEEGNMIPGTTFTIEPILCQGSAAGIMWPDQWTISTVDGGRSAQFEHTIVITEDGLEIFTE